MLLVAVPLGAVLIYLQLGSPGAPDMPLAGRGDLSAQAPDDAQHQNMMAQLRQDAEANPDDPDAWLRLAAAYKSAQMFDKALEAFQRALALGPASPLLSGEYAETLVMAAGGTVTPEARTAFEATLAGAPGDPRAQYYLAVADYQAGRTREAMDRWGALIEGSPADAPWIPVVRQQFTTAAEELGLDAAAIMPEPQTARGADGAALSPEQRAAMESMTPEEREEMIAGMVDQLSARLEESPMDLEGWERLIRSYAVLDRPQDAQEALDRALAVFAEAPFPKQRLTELAGELNLAVAQDDEAVPDVGEMVERLAERLKAKPDDLQGWMMLARSYEVLGEPEKALDALRQAERVAPDNPDILIQQARAIRTANGGGDTAESLAIMERVLAIAPDNIEAMWFVANAEAAKGNTERGLDLLRRLYDRIPEGNADRALVEQRIRELGG